MGKGRVRKQSQETGRTKSENGWVQVRKQVGSCQEICRCGVVSQETAPETTGTTRRGVVKGLESSGIRFRESGNIGDSGGNCGGAL